MKKVKIAHIGVYGVLIKDESILLIKKVNGPYKGKLDLPGGSIEFGERPDNALIRELKEETGLCITKYEFNNSDSVVVKWHYDEKEITTHHIGIFYAIKSYKGEVKNRVRIDDKNDDSLGANFYKIKDLKVDEISSITKLQLEKLGYFK